MFPETFNLARKAAILAAEDQPIDSNIETDYDKPRKRQLPARFQSSDDDDWEENICTKRKRQERSREMQRTEDSIPGPSANIREQLAALKTQISHSKKLKSNESHVKKTKVVKKLISTGNEVSSRKSPLKGNYKLNL